jgi:hypothetical protein
LEDALSDGADGVSVSNLGVSGGIGRVGGLGEGRGGGLVEVLIAGIPKAKEVAIDETVR